MSLQLRNKWISRILFALFFLATGMLLSCGILVLWFATYPDTGDPKNIYYVLWKHGLNDNMNLDNALESMVGDRHSERLVVGLTKEQLKSRFRTTRTYEEVGPYYQKCDTPNGLGVRSVQPPGREVVFLRDSQYMVVLQNDRAVDLVLCKGY